MQASYMRFSDRSPLNHLEFIWRMIANGIGTNGKQLHEAMISFYKTLAPAMLQYELEFTYELRKENGRWMEYLTSKDESSDSNYLSIVCMHAGPEQSEGQKKQTKKQRGRCLDIFNTYFVNTELFHPAYNGFVRDIVTELVGVMTDEYNVGVMVHSDNVVIVSFSSLLNDSRLDFIMRPMGLVAEEAIFNMYQLRRIGHAGGIDHRTCH